MFILINIFLYAWYFWCLIYNFCLSQSYKNIICYLLEALALFFYLTIDLESIFAYGARNNLSPVSHGNIQLDLYMLSSSIDSFGFSILRIKIMIARLPTFKSLYLFFLFLALLYTRTSSKCKAVEVILPASFSHFQLQRENIQYATTVHNFAVNILHVPY